MSMVSVGPYAQRIKDPLRDLRKAGHIVGGYVGVPLLEGYNNWQDGRLPLHEDTSVSSCMMLGVEYAVVWQSLEVARVPDDDELHGVVVQPTHVGVATEASPVGQEHEGGGWFVGLEGGVHSVAKGLEHDSVTMRRIAEGVATVACSEGISACPKVLVAVTCAKISVLGTVKFKRVGKTFRGYHAPVYAGRCYQCVAVMGLFPFSKELLWWAFFTYM
eukprot:1137299-Pelagomonas_calceolata.AAC.2